MKRNSAFILVVLTISALNVCAQPIQLANERIIEYLTPTRVLWKNGSIKNEVRLLKKRTGQADLDNTDRCIIENRKDEKGSILLDFGKEIQGGVQIVTGIWTGNKPIKIRLRFGESASEAMSAIDGKGGATNDHAIRDFETLLPWLGIAELGNTGFRFVRIDVIDQDVKLVLKEVNAIAKYRKLTYKGSFNSSDTLLNKIWKTGAYTVQLNMQDYLWDGIKRDRLVWVGDLNPEITTINAVFGYNEVVPKSLDFARNTTPLPQWMNGISAYSMWWIINHRDWYYQNGNFNYLKEQQPYLGELLKLMIKKIDANGKENLDGQRFLDWPSSEDPEAIHAGLQAMMVLALRAGGDLMHKLGDEISASNCAKAVNLLEKYSSAHPKSKQAAALLSMAKLISAKEGDQIISEGGAAKFSTFFGYYMLQAKANATNYTGAMEVIREYWGAMLDLGATTFWEDFNLDWVKNAARIDELVPDGKIDIHGTYGAYCYIGYRHSLCHGWAAGPTPWLTEHVLGISVIEPGCKVVQVKPHLGNLNFAEGTFPTPMGLIKVRHEKRADGTIKSIINAPKGVKIIR
ncbi:alpha-L-rhamnosidase C-terminal domain-containing protein [Pedobacter sp. Du54]|uniref:alpha-L-rhamnosidase-related protein n=1 Tax=Pedobacter anseongensis TaxID=3133439 RepID=UPI0030992EE1